MARGKSMAKTKRTGLGKGLDALITNTEPSLTPATKSENREGVQEIAPENIQSNPRQPRQHFNQDELDELAASIEEHGVIQPLIVSANEDGTYTLIAGERRLKASKQAKLARVPVVIRNVTDQQQLEWALIENVQRADLSALEEAEAYTQLNEEFGLSHQSIARQVGKSRVAITNTMRLLKLSKSVKIALIEKKITEGHARAILGLANEAEQTQALPTVLSLNLNVRQTEQYVKLFDLLNELPEYVIVPALNNQLTEAHLELLKEIPSNERRRVVFDKIIVGALTIDESRALLEKLDGKREKSPVVKQEKSPEVTDIEERLRSRFETKVLLRYTPDGGSITLHYASDEDLDALLEKLL
jgi:ParB family chromosome partitioning protein